MAVFPGTYIEVGVHESPKMNRIIDEFLTPRLKLFRQVVIYNEPAVLQSDGITWKLTYGGWNTAYKNKVFLNGGLLDSGYTLDAVFGTVVIDGGVSSGDTVSAQYCFDYFGISTLAGIINQSILTAGTASMGSLIGYTIDTLPDAWLGVVADLAFAICMERLILDYDMWVGRLIFAIPGVEEGGDIVSQLETLKRNAEDRAYKTLENPRFKNPNHVALPTETYYASVRGIGRGSRMRGWRPSRYL